jgi:flagellar biosynthesis GTPase FlhF
VSTTQVQASDASQAKKLVEAQYGKDVTVLSTKRLQKK